MFHHSTHVPFSQIKGFATSRTKSQLGPLDVLRRRRRRKVARVTPSVAPYVRHEDDGDGARPDNERTADKYCSSGSE